MDLGLGHRAGAVVLHAQQAQQALGGRRQQLDERLGGQRQPVDGAGDQPGQRFGIALAQALGHQFADDDGEVRDDHHDHAGGRVAGGLVVHAHGPQPFAQRLGQGGLADDTVEHPDGGDADLDGGEEAGGVFTQLHGGDCAAVALICQLLQPRLARRDQCQLRHGKQAIEEDEGEKYCYFHKGEARCFLGVEQAWIVGNPMAARAMAARAPSAPRRFSRPLLKPNAAAAPSKQGHAAIKRVAINRPKGRSRGCAR